MAKGEYLQFLDSDDWLTPNATEIFMRTVTEQDCDMVIADFYRVIEERVSQKGDIDKVVTHHEEADRERGSVK